MSDIETTYTAPIIFTKDKEWVQERAQQSTLTEGDVILLPDDAILYIQPQTIGVQSKKVG